MNAMNLHTFISFLLQLHLHTFISFLLQLQELHWSWQEMHNMMWWKCMHGFTVSMLLSIVCCHASSSAAVQYAADCPPPPPLFSLPPPPAPNTTTWTQPVIFQRDLYSLDRH